MRANKSFHLQHQDNMQTVKKNRFDILIKKQEQNSINTLCKKESSFILTRKQFKKQKESKVICQDCLKIKRQNFSDRIKIITLNTFFVASTIFSII